jgi:hypothetical protein
MSSVHNQTGIIIASISAAVVVGVCIGTVIFQGRLPIIRKTPPSVEQEIEAHREGTHIRMTPRGEYEKYGELYIAADRQPTVAALDIITRILVAIGLPSKARVPGASRLSPSLKLSSEVVELPRFCLTVPDRESLKTLNTVDIPLVAVPKVRRSRRSQLKEV